MKKGATHADWAISLGLFLVYILTMFMILQPGVQPVYVEEQLLDVVKVGLDEKASFVLAKTPLIIDTSKGVFEGEGDYTIEVTGTLPFENGGNKAAVFTEDGEYIDESLIDKESGKLSFVGHIVPGVNRFWVYEIRYPEDGQEAYTYDNSFPVPALEPKITDDKGNFTYTFGSPEVLRGFDMASLDENVFNHGILCENEEHYTTLKARFNFPENKEFTIYYVGKSTPRYAEEDVMDICDIAEPFEQASVFTQEWATNSLDKEGKMQPMRINIKVW